MQVDDITPLVEDYKIEDAETILAQMKMYDAVSTKCVVCFKMRKMYTLYI